MGHITIFTISNCAHCRRVKAALDSRFGNTSSGSSNSNSSSNNGKSYVEINLTLHPSARVSMLQLTDRLTVPQVFFNEKHIGGADETIAYLERVEQEQAPLSVNPVDVAFWHQWYDSNIASPPDPTDERLLPLETSAIDMVDDSSNEVITSRPSNQLPRRLGCSDTPHILNRYCIWSPAVDDDTTTGKNAESERCLRLVRQLQLKLSNILDQCTDAATGRVNYRQALKHANFEHFDYAACQLQTVNVLGMDTATKTAFCINLYNMLVEYAFCKVGIPTTAATRSLFFNSVSVVLAGGLIFTLNDVEHGILRANHRPPYAWSAPFVKSDPRIQASLSQQDLDCRIHFALNCGATSCPPVQNFTAMALQEELRIVAQAFCEQEDNVRFHVDSDTLHLSKIFYWYQADFAPSRSQLAAAILPFLRGEKRQQLQAALDSGKAVQIQFVHYDWSTKASDGGFTHFDRSVIRANEPLGWKRWFSF